MVGVLPPDEAAARERSTRNLLGSAFPRSFPKNKSLALHYTIPLQFVTQPTGHAFPTFNFLDGSTTGIGQDRVGQTLSKTYEFTDNFTIIKHNHTMRFGFDTRRVLYNALMYFYASDDYGQFNFTGSLTGYSLGDFLLGAPQSNFADIGGPQVNAYAWHWGVYGQDEWQVNKHLTVNFGLRWELQPAMTETNGDLANFVPSLNAIVVPDKFSSLLKTYAPATPAYIADLRVLQWVLAHELRAEPQIHRYRVRM